MKNIIIPSTKLKIISTHKLNDLSCFRYYHWHRVQNLEPKKLSLNFWYGAVFGAGFEQMAMDGKYSLKTEKAMNAESKKRLSRYIVSNEDREEIDLQLRLIKAILQGAEKQSFFSEMRMTKHQAQVSYKITPEIIFYGTLDGLGIYKKKNSTFEIKTAAQVTDNTFKALKYDKQVYGYPLGLKASGKSYPVKCCYLIFRKTSKKVKKNQSLDDFVQEIKEDIEFRPEFYYICYPITLGKETMKGVKQDILAGTRILKTIYDSMTKKELLDPENWPCQERQCLSFGACPYIMLCQYSSRWKAYSKLFQQRERLYEEEKEELNL